MVHAHDHSQTFHFAGVASMNITLGVPRIKEIIDATKNIKASYITVRLREPLSEEAARKVKGTIERVVLRDIVDYTAEVLYLPLYVLTLRFTSPTLSP